jgi:hypothetical protein
MLEQRNGFGKFVGLSVLCENILNERGVAIVVDYIEK